MCMFCLFSFVGRCVTHSANAQHLPGMKVTDIDLAAGAASQPVPKVTVAAVQPERGRSRPVFMISRSVVRELMSMLNVVLYKQIYRHFSKNKMQKLKV